MFAIAAVAEVPLDLDDMFGHQRRLRRRAVADDVGDTHWYRAEVDAFFAEEARRDGVALLEEFAIDEIKRAGGWTIGGQTEEAPKMPAEPTYIVFKLP